MVLGTTALSAIFRRNEVPDVEEQSITQAHPTSAEAGGRLDGPTMTSPFGIESLAGETGVNSEIRADQYCFLCLEGKGFDQYTIRVPCLRPTKPRRVKGYHFSR